MIGTSLKHLRRTPGKALLFVLLLAGATTLLIFGAQLLVQPTQKIHAAEAQFTTIATVEQVSAGTENSMYYDKCTGFYSGYEELYDDPVSLDILNFEGANYIHPPENRPYYLSEIEGKRITGGISSADHIIEFTALADQKEADQHVQARVEKVHFEAVYTSGGGKEDHALGGIDQVLPAPAEGCGELFTECPGGRNGLIILDHLAQIEVQVRIGNLIVHPLEGGGQPLDLIADIGKRLFQRDDILELIGLAEDLQKALLLEPEGRKAGFRIKILVADVLHRLTLRKQVADAPNLADRLVELFGRDARLNRSRALLHIFPTAMVGVSVAIDALAFYVASLFLNKSGNLLQ